MRGPRRAPAPHDGDRRPCGGVPARRRARSGGRWRSPNPPGAPSRDVRSRGGTIPMLRGRPARACCGPCSVSFLGCWGRGGRCGFKGISPGSGLWDGRGPVVPVGGGMVVAPSSPWGGRRGRGGVFPGGVLLFRSLVGAVPSALGGLASGFGMGPGVSLPRCGRRDGGGVVVRPRWPAPLACGGGGWVGPGLRSGRGGFAPPPCAGGGVRGGGSCRPISTGRLSPLPGLHLRPIDPVVHWGPSTTPRGGLCGDLVLEVVSRLDAFSGYPSRTWPTSGAPGGTTGAPEVRPSRSSRTGDGSPQVSCARRG